MKNIIRICLLALAVNSAQAQDKAADLLKSVSAKYRSYSSIKASFTVSMDDTKKKSSNKQSGTVWLKGNKYRLDIAGQEIISDSKTEWVFVKESNEVQVKEPSSNTEGISPTNIFTMYDKGFEYKMGDKEKVNGKELQIIELSPSDKKKRFFKIKLYIDPAQKSIYQSVIFNKDGMRNTYTIDKFQANAPIADTEFTFNKDLHKGVEIIDLR